MEYNQYGTPIETSPSGDKPKKEEESSSSKSSSAKEIWIPLPKVEAEDKHPKDNIFGNNLGEWLGTKKAAESDQGDDKPEVAVVDDEEVETDQLDKLEHLNGGPAPQAEVIDVQRLVPMEKELDIPLNREPIKLPELPQIAEHFAAREEEDEPELPLPSVVQPERPEPEKITPRSPDPAESDGGSDEPPPPRGPEHPPGQPPEPERPPEPPEAVVMTLPDHMRPELIQQAQAINPSAEQVQPPSAELPSHYHPHRHPEHDGTIIGLGLFEAWRHHRMNKRNRKVQAKQNKRMKQIEQAQAEARQQQERASAEQALKERRLQRELAARPTTNEVATDRQELAKRLWPAETAPRPAAEVAKKVAPIEQIIEEQPIHLPPEHHLVRSEWHNIEVDKSGRPVEAPVLAYGQEFKRELHQEARAQDEHTAASAVGYSAINNTTLSTPGQPSLPTDIPIQGPLPSTVQLPRPPKPNTTHDLTTLWLWVILIIIIFAIFATLILR